MRILITGRGTSGSWQIRGVQLGQAMAAHVQAGAHDAAGYDVAIGVKRIEPGFAVRCRAAGIPFVWDIVDAWPQPVGNLWTKAECMAWLSSQLHMLRPAGVVAATRQMAEDVRTMYQGPVLWLPHHARPGIEARPARDRVELVAYEGGADYVRGWWPHVERACHTRGWRCLINAPDLATADIVLALRDATGYAPRAWKSAVKQANAHATGRAFVGVREAGYLEMATPTDRFADTPQELERAFDELAPLKDRQDAREAGMAATLSLQATAQSYVDWLCKLKS